MATTAPLKNHPSWKEWMAQADPLKEVSMVKKLITHYFTEWTIPSGVLEKTYCLYKYLMLQKDPLNSSWCQKIQYPERKLRL